MRHEVLIRDRPGPWDGEIEIEGGRIPKNFPPILGYAVSENPVGLPGLMQKIKWVGAVAYCPFWLRRTASMYDRLDKISMTLLSHQYLPGGKAFKSSSIFIVYASVLKFKKLERILTGLFLFKICL